MLQIRDDIATCFETALDASYVYLGFETTCTG